MLPLFECFTDCCLQASIVTTGVSIYNHHTKCPALNPVIGKVGQESAAARYAATTAAPDFAIEADKPYAEVI